MKKFLPPLLFIALLTAGFFWWRSRPAESDGTNRAYGNIDVRNLNVAFRVGGRLVELRVDEGDRVEAGAVLGRLDAEPLELAAVAADAQVDRARAQLERMEAGFREEEIAAARAALAQAEAAAERAQREWDRQRDLTRTGASTPQVLDAAEANARETQARVRAAEAQLALLTAGNRKEDIAQARAELAAVEARRAEIALQIRDATLEAPSAGIVQTRVVEPGTIVSPGQTILNLALVDRVWARAYLPEPQLGHIAPGQPVEVFTDSRPDEPYHGRIGFISPTAEFTPKNVETTDLRTQLIFRFHVILEDADDGLRQGMPVTIHWSD